MNTGRNDCEFVGCPWPQWCWPYCWNIYLYISGCELSPCITTRTTPTPPPPTTPPADTCLCGQARRRPPVNEASTDTDKNSESIFKTPTDDEFKDCLEHETSNL